MKPMSDHTHHNMKRATHARLKNSYLEISNRVAPKRRKIEQSDPPYKPINYKRVSPDDATTLKEMLLSKSIRDSAITFLSQNVFTGSKKETRIHFARSFLNTIELLACTRIKKDDFSILVSHLCYIFNTELEQLDPSKCHLTQIVWEMSRSVLCNTKKTTMQKHKLVSIAAHLVITYLITKSIARKKEDYIQAPSQCDEKTLATHRDSVIQDLAVNIFYSKHKNDLLQHVNAKMFLLYLKSLAFKYENIEKKDFKAFKEIAEDLCSTIEEEVIKEKIKKKPFYQN